MHPDDMRTDLSPGQLLARDVRSSRAEVKDAKRRIERARTMIAESEAFVASETARQDAMREAMVTLGYNPDLLIDEPEFVERVAA